MCGLFALPSDHFVTASAQAHAAGIQARAARPCSQEPRRRVLAEVGA